MSDKFVKYYFKIKNKNNLIYNFVKILNFTFKLHCYQE